MEQGTANTFGSNAIQMQLNKDFQVTDARVFKLNRTTTEQTETID